MRPWPDAKDSDLQMYESISRVFLGREHLLEQFFEPTRPKIRFVPEVMLKRFSGCSSGEYLLIKIALDLWCGAGEARVWELVEVLDPSTFYFVVEAMVIARRNRF